MLASSRHFLPSKFDAGQTKRKNKKMFPRPACECVLVAFLMQIRPIGRRLSLTSQFPSQLSSLVSGHPRHPSSGHPPGPPTGGPPSSSSMCPISRPLPLRGSRNTCTKKSRSLGARSYPAEASSVRTPSS